ncbi:hypothetical protein AURDEDRAFT_177983 [Auricularia subglabra TFB-10046 SS5]|uniref:Uncharacterized protein n=1 Tax=Auricularia subglabra (strain TFB-10046 / SS5) TaxID=717982 RepID=J0L999_AURST|nr:hypothetical protein AURDEDRAFT_177983 [Auricularia subglabra TFB-10046 SS5]
MLSLAQAYRLARTSLAAISNSSRMSATVLGPPADALPGPGVQSGFHDSSRDIAVPSDAFNTPGCA